MSQPTPFESVLNTVRKLTKAGRPVEVSAVSSFTGLSNTEVMRAIEQLQAFDAPVRLSEDKLTIEVTAGSLAV